MAMCRKSLPARLARAGRLFLHSVGINFLHKVQKELSPYL
jgi:hypothetical protein